MYEYSAALWPEILTGIKHRQFDAEFPTIGGSFQPAYSRKRTVPDIGDIPDAIADLNRGIAVAMRDTDACCGTASVQIQPALFAVEPAQRLQEGVPQRQVAQ